MIRTGCHRIAGRFYHPCNRLIAILEKADYLIDHLRFVGRRCVAEQAHIARRAILSVRHAAAAPAQRCEELANRRPAFLRGHVLHPFHPLHPHSCMWESSFSSGLRVLLVFLQPVPENFSDQPGERLPSFLSDLLDIPVQTIRYAD